MINCINFIFSVLQQGISNIPVCSLIKLSMINVIPWVSQVQIVV